MLYLIDGYNVTKSDPATRDLSLEAQRTALTRRLAARGGSLLGPGPIVIVFDGQGGPGYGDERIGGVTASYAMTEKADDEIVRRAQSATGQVTVVTNDGGIRRRVRGDLGERAKVLPSECCFEGTRAAAPKRDRGRITRDAGLPEGHNTITEEMKRLFGVDE